MKGPQRHTLCNLHTYFLKRHDLRFWKLVKKGQMKRPSPWLAHSLLALAAFAFGTFVASLRRTFSLPFGRQGVLGCSAGFGRCVRHDITNWLLLAAASPGSLTATKADCPTQQNQVGALASRDADPPLCSDGQFRIDKSVVKLGARAQQSVKFSFDIAQSRQN